MKLNHCNNDFKTYDVWFLFDNAGFRNRRLLLGTCPVCKKDVVSLIEERKQDGRIFVQQVSGMKAVDLIDNSLEKREINYAEHDLKIKQGKGAPLGLCYGDNKEIHNNKGEVVGIRVNRCDFFGQKETIQDGRDIA